MKNYQNHFLQININSELRLSLSQVSRSEVEMRVRSSPIEIQKCWLKCQWEKIECKLSSKFKYPDSSDG